MRQFNTTEERIRNILEISQDALLRSLRTIRVTPGLFLLSLGLSSALWIFITEEENPTRIDELSRPLNVQAFNVEPGLAVANQLPSVEVILAAADRDSKRLRGDGEAQAIAILAESLNKDPEFFSFRRSLDAYKEFLNQDTTVILSSESEIFKYLQSPGQGSSETTETR